MPERGKCFPDSVFPPSAFHSGEKIAVPGNRPATKISFPVSSLGLQKEILLMQKDDRHIGRSIGRTGSRQICEPGVRSCLVGCFLKQVTDFSGILFPLPQIAYPMKILVIQQKFQKTCLCHINRSYGCLQRSNARSGGVLRVLGMLGMSIPGVKWGVGVTTVFPPVPLPPFSGEKKAPDFSGAGIITIC